MEAASEVGVGEARASLVDGLWILSSDRDHLAELAAAATTRRPEVPLRWVVAAPTDADRQVAADAGLSPRRDVLQLRRPLPVEPALTDAYPPVEVRAFRPGTGDEEAWITCNNRSFADHPDQSGFTPDRLHRLMGEPWFDPAGFLLHHEDDRLVGFCWTKVHDLVDPALGEIFVIGVDPDIAGRGMGGALTLAGLGWLARRGLTAGMLYVDGENQAARRLYNRLGFAVHHTERLFESR